MADKKSGKPKLDKEPAILDEDEKARKSGVTSSWSAKKPQKKQNELVLQVMRAKLSEMLTDDERDALADTLSSPGYRVMHKISRLLQADWGDQLISANYRNTPPEAIANFVVDAQGMKNGLIAYFRMLNVYKKVVEKAEKSRKSK